jgi:soluble lytic murein transglycosylase-like protein
VFRRATILAAAAALASPGTAAAITNPQIPGLQVALRAHGFYAGQIDGISGPLTARGIRAFQRSHGLKPDALAGRTTRRALGRLGRPFFGRRVLVRGQIGWDVSVLQFLLARHGFATPRLNGNFGPGTERAVIRFQRRAGLAQDGIVGRATQAALLRARLPAARRAARRASRPPTPRYVVRAGDSLTAIAARYRSTVPALARANRLDPSRVLLIGTRLRVPIVTLPTPAAGARSWLVRASLDRWSAHYGVDPHLARGLAWMESGFQSNLTSPAGAWGVMQVTPATWEYVETVLVGSAIPRTADGNVRVGVAYLAHLLREFRGDQRLALAGWYQGPASVRKRGLLRESQAFVADVLALKSRM